MLVQPAWIAAPALQAGLLGCDATGGQLGLQVDRRAMGRPPRLETFALDKGFHGDALLCSEGLESFGDGGARALVVILADLPLAFEAFDVEFNTDDAFCH